MGVYMDLATIRKIASFTFWYIIWTNLWYLVVIPDFYQKWNLLALLILSTAIGFFDHIFRPIKEEKVIIDKYLGILLLLFIGNPFLGILSFYENQLFVSKIAPLWDNFLIHTLGLFFVAVGGIITVTGRYQLGKYATGMICIQEEHKLITRGIFKYVRHPIYSGGVISAIGIQLCFATLVMLLIYPCLVFYVVNIRLIHEEDLLIQRFGDQYRVYQQKSKKLLPFLY